MGMAGAGGGAGGTGTGGSGTPGMSAGCGKAPTIASSMYNNGNPISITAANLQRRYILSVPTNYDNTKAYKLVIAYHARDSNDHSVYNEHFYGMQPLSNNTTIFVAPNGQKNGAPCSGTGVGDSSCGWPNPSDQDMQLADAVVKQVEDNFCVDTNRIFATGWSYGASMSEQTACERPLGGTQTEGWGVRAIAIYAVAYLSNTTNCKASKPVAYYATHGTCDSVLTYDGTSRCSTSTGTQGGVGVAKDWATVDGCTWQLPTKVTSGAHVCTKLSGCMTGYPLEFCSFNGDHTAYPDNGQEQGSWGPAEAWAFLNQF
jgi:poly(3-hydroxybutyrate) depolymerase